MNVKKKIKQSSLDAEYIKKEKLYIAFFFAGILIIALLAIGIMIYLAFFQ